MNDNIYKRFRSFAIYFYFLISWLLFVFIINNPRIRMRHYKRRLPSDNTNLKNKITHFYY